MANFGFTQGCSACTKIYAQCVMDSCSAECGADPTGASCQSCYTTKCLPDFMGCTGLQPQAMLMAPVKTLEEPLNGACTNPTDTALVGDMESDMITCFGQEKSADGVASCMANFGFTQGCAACTKIYAQCVMDSCSAECGAD